MELFSREYRAQDVHRATNINKETLRVWRRRGYVYGADLGGGEKKGGWTQYSFYGICSIALMLEVTTQQRVDASIAYRRFLQGTMGRHLHDAIHAYAAGGPDVWLFAAFGEADPHDGGSRIAASVARNPEEIFSSVSRLTSVLALNVGEVIRQVVARLRATNSPEVDEPDLVDAE